MIRLKYGVRVLLGGTLVYAVACGGSSSPGDLGGAGPTPATNSFAGATASGGQPVRSTGTTWWHAPRRG